MTTFESNNLDDVQAQETGNLSSEETANKSKKAVKLSEQWWFILLQVLVIPLTLALIGYGFTLFQTDLTNKRQDADSADKARETREQVLTDYSKQISELVTKHNLNNFGKGADTYVRSIAKGQTFIALRRLDVSDKNGEDDQAKAEDDQAKAKVDAGKLKGLLIRYLHDAWLIGYLYKSEESKPEEPVEPTIILGGANITDVVLENAWLEGINLRGAVLNNGNFRNAFLKNANLSNTSLRNVDFTGADLTDADLTGADLRFAKLKSAKNMDSTKLDGACYIENQTDFPSEFKPKNMIAIDQDRSEPGKPNYEKCPPASRKSE
ncbi:MAG: pentapeptide repeat-containing protein [Leptolyngbyaceae cyanobacterium bins.349]|nr:pentapeptide repeat-containing protein [Leptolyngbyaceae cyanobacterium bins.349]